MGIPKAGALLDLWERGRDESPPARALGLLAAWYPDETPEALAGLPVGRRDARLIELRRQTFGHEFDSEAFCPSCGERLEFVFHGDDIAPNVATIPMEPLQVAHGEFELELRLPTSADVLATMAESPPEDREADLRRRCILAARHDGTGIDAASLPDEVLETIDARLAEADPQADTRLALACPVCEHQWQEPFDITSYLWTELDSRVNRLLQDVHTLAAAYGWSESDVLAMSPWRRQQYTAMITA